MARGDGDRAEYAGVSDARLTELLRGAPPTAFTALQELRARHQEATLAYARLCTAGESGARQLAAQAFTLAARRTARGTDPGEPWRHHLLLTAGEIAAQWAADDRSAGLDAGLLLVLSTAGPGAPVPPMLAAFRSLPSRARGLVWYGVLDREPTDRAATLLGLLPKDVAYDTAPALQALGRACLRSRLAASDDPSCPDFQRLIEESVRPDGPRHSADLTAHMAHCAHCATAYEELSALRDSPHTALAEGLLPWAGAGYARRERPAVTGADTGARASGRGGPILGISARDASERYVSVRGASMPDTSVRDTSIRGASIRDVGLDRTWPPSRRFALASAALGVALAPLLVLLMSPDGPDAERTAQPVTPSPVPSVVTTTAPVPATPTPSPSPSPTRSPSPAPKPTTPRPSPTTPPPPAFHPPGAAYAQVVNVSSGRCLDIPGRIEKGADVSSAPCDSSRTQRWRVDVARGVVQSAADPEFCLDSRGSVERGVGVWPCGSVEGRNGQNLRFAVDDQGRIRPAIAIGTAVTPADSGYGLWLKPLDGDAEQRWRAGPA
ncbi:ricin-type beta-trefoil lectin domain protein [Streptomyces sp. NPDC057877]|uniref:ricin-type beta-trefoil lectin domain protein n=1 Tax=Streptomyces sp. NPDC057877 TaxID=3346269 RepID=UPI0036C4339D